MIGRRLGQYEVLEPLGRGGMGEVYRARDEVLQRNVALKLLPAELAGDPARLARLKREARALAALNHPHVATIHGFEERDGVSFIVMELVDGETLAEKLENGPFTVAVAVEIATQIARGLGAAHERGIVHRDLKPANVKVTAGGNVKILDLGLAKSLSTGGQKAESRLATADVPETETGAFLGTVAYTSPEQARGETVDAGSDLFSLGIILYEMLTGEHPFLGLTAATTFDRILNVDPDPPVDRDDAIPSCLSALVMRLLRKERTERCASAAEVRDRLEELQRELRTSSRTTTFPGRGDGSVGPRPPADAGTSRRRSIAVLPFVNMSPDPDNEYFGDGLAEELINALTRVGGLRVAARTSAFCFKEDRRDIREIGETLDVDSVLEGSVRRSGDRLRITVQLVDTADGYHLWSQRYDRQMADIFEIQDEITEAIVERMKVELATGETPVEPAVTRRPTDDVEAYNLYLRGRHFWAQRTPEAFRKAIDCFEEALERDPAFAQAHAGVADAWATLGAYALIPAAEARRQAGTAVERALELNRHLPEPHNTRGMVKLLLTTDWHSAGAHFRRALELDPGFSLARAYLAAHLALMGMPEEAESEIRRALEQDPLSSLVHALASAVFYISGRYALARELAARGLEIDPASAFCRWGHAFACRRLGDLDGAVASLERLVRETGRSVIFVAMLGNMYAAAGREREARELVEELERRAEHEYVADLTLLLARLPVEEDEVLLENLRACVETGWGPVAYVSTVKPELDELREDARYRDLITALRLDPPG